MVWCKSENLWCGDSGLRHGTERATFRLGGVQRGVGRVSFGMRMVGFGAARGQRPSARYRNGGIQWGQWHLAWGRDSSVRHGNGGL